MIIRRVGFYIPRANYLREMGPLIEYLVRERSADYRVTALLPRWNVSKPQLRVDVKTFNDLWGESIKVRELRTVSALADVIRAGDIEALLSLQPELSDIGPADIAALRMESVKQGIKWVALPDCFTQDALVVIDVPSVLANWDVVCTAGPRSVRYIEEHLRDVEPQAARTLLSRIAAVGDPKFDGLRNLSCGRDIRRKYGLPQDKPVVFLATAPRIVPLSVNSWVARSLDTRFRSDSVWSARRALARLKSLHYPILLEYRRYLDALRRFADKNRAILVAKTRAKHQDPQFVGDFVDHLIGDHEFFPFTTLELLKTANLYFGFYSNTASEAVVSEVYALTALFLPPHVAEGNRDWRWRKSAEAMNRGPSGLWQVPGVSEIIHGTTAAGATALNRFADSTLEQYRIDEGRRRDILSDLYSDLGNSSARVIGALEACKN